ncbi:MAG TPA: DUF1801 domain-containing protein [Gaiellaceae bacterium]|nr:DUF1801 domain-containing protein [Gaiellaceae bacterium]
MPAKRPARKGFTAEERAAMKEYAAELQKGETGERDVLEKIAEMPEGDRAMAERLHAIVKEVAPQLSPRTWYGMPAYAKDDKVVCFFQSAQKFKSRYATLGFSDKANLDDGAMWPTGFALKELTAAAEARIVALLKKAVSGGLQPGAHSRRVLGDRCGKGGVVKNSAPQTPRSASESIDARIRELGDWRGALLSRLRALVKEADPDVIEELKWAKATSPGTPVWSHDGMICTGETYKSVVKMTFAKGASLEDPLGLFNSSLEGNVRRAIDFYEGGEIDEEALKALVRSAVALNTSRRA